MLCAKCLDIMNQNPIGVIYRKDKDGMFLLCRPCKNIIFDVHEKTANGEISFSFIKPHPQYESSKALSKRHLHAVPRKKITWLCHKCNKQIFATPRAYEGSKEEPVDWWWCKTCQWLRVEDMQASIAKKKVDEQLAKNRSKKKSLTDKKHSAELPLSDLQTLERWFKKQ
jgi:hypothetical protein